MNIDNARTPDAPPGKAARQRRWRRRWPLLIPIGMIAGLLWASYWFSRRAQLLDDAGSVNFDAPTWRWLEKIGGPEMRITFASPTSLSLSGERPTRGQLRMVSGFMELTSFSCGGLTDDDLFALRQLSNLQRLSLGRSAISDVGCEALTHFPKLTSLSIITDQPLSANGLAHVGTLDQLTRIYLEAPGLNDAALEPLGNLSRLESLFIRDAEITGDGLRRISQIPRLSRIALTECQITPSALTCLQGSPTGLNLILSGSTITDEHLAALDSLTWLVSVSCGNTQVTRAACEAFAESHPGVMVTDALGNKIVVDPVYTKPDAESGSVP